MLLINDVERNIFFPNLCIGITFDIFRQLGKCENDNTEFVI